MNGIYVRLDLFTPEDGPEPPTAMTRLPRGEAVLARATDVVIHARGRDIKLRTPSVVDFVLMKLDATRIRRPRDEKDAFDLYAYVRKKKPAVVGEAVARARECDEALARIRELFGDESGQGVQDVLSFAPTLESPDRQLVVRDVLRAFSEVERTALAARRG